VTHTKQTPPPNLADVDEITPDDNLLADVHRTRLTTPVTRVLIALVVIGGAFLAGAVVERTQHKTSSASSNLSALAAQFRNRLGGGTSGTGGTGTGGGGAGNGGTTIGTIKLVDGNNVYVQDFSGNVVKYTTNSTTTVTLRATATVKQLKPGTSVIVQGSASTDGASTATSISQSSGIGGGGGGPFGGGGGG
jgi:uncharacterized membrane protein YgcG